MGEDAKQLKGQRVSKQRAIDIHPVQDPVGLSTHAKQIDFVVVTERVAQLDAVLRLWK